MIAPTDHFFDTLSLPIGRLFVSVQIHLNIPKGRPCGRPRAYGDMGLLSQGAVQEGDDLGAVADGIHTEGAVVHAVGDALLNCPCHGGGVPRG